MNLSTTRRIAAYRSWANTRDRSARAAAGVAGQAAKWLREARERLGPDATDQQVALAADAARKAHYAILSAAGVAARRANSATARTDAA